MDVLRSTSRRDAHRPVGLTEPSLRDVEKAAAMRRGHVEVETFVEIQIHTEPRLFDFDFTP